MMYMLCDIYCMYNSIYCFARFAFCQELSLSKFMFFWFSQPYFYLIFFQCEMTFAIKSESDL